MYLKLVSVDIHHRHVLLMGNYGLDSRILGIFLTNIKKRKTYLLYIFEIFIDV